MPRPAKRIKTLDVPLDIDSGVQPFRVPKTAELLARDLRNRIVRGELKDGETLPSEAELVTQFQVSRPTLREALRILESESLLTVTRGSRGGPRIHMPNPRHAARHFGLVLQSRGTTLADIYQARLLIEPSCARLVALDSRRGALAILRQVIALERETFEDDVAHSKASARFHRALIEVTGNPPLMLLMAMLTHIYESHLSTAAIAASVRAIDAVSKQRGIAAHEKLVALIQAGDGDKAETFWRQHLEGIEKIIRAANPVDKAIDILD
jgi:DNA-binding FadR family transcriptional regulator